MVSGRENPVGKVARVDAPSGTHATLGGRYELVAMVGLGGMAQVWRSYDRVLRREVAVKILAAHTSDDPSSLARFRREARHVAALSHPNIVPVYDFGVAEGRTYLVMEYIDGPSLRDLLSPRLTAAPTACVAIDVLSALDHAHRRGIVHRDIKPANILLAPDGTARVADFGVARAEADTTDLTAVGSFVGTATYASPEQFTGTAIGPASDLYSLGCVLYRCLAGHPPFEADDPGRLVLRHRFADAESLLEVAPGTPPALAAIIERAMAKDPGDRFPDAVTMRRAIQPLAGPGLDSMVQRWSSHRETPPMPPAPTSHASTRTRPPSTPTDVGNPTHLAPPTPARPTVAPGRRRRRVRGLAGAGIVFLVVVGAGLAGWGLVHSGTHQPVPSVLPSGGTLRPGRSILSPDRTYELTMQSDGNLVEYRTTARVTEWETGTSGNFGAYAVVQADGDFVVYPQGKTSPAPGEPTPALWSSGTFGHPGASVALQDSGAVVVRASDHGTVLWSNQ